MAPTPSTTSPAFPLERRHRHRHYLIDARLQCIDTIHTPFHQPSSPAAVCSGEFVPYDEDYKTGQVFSQGVKDTLDLFATLIVSLNFTTHKQYRGTYVLTPRVSISSNVSYLLYAPIYNGLYAALAFIFICNGLNAVLSEFRLDDNYTHFALCAVMPLPFCVSLDASIESIYDVVEIEDDKRNQLLQMDGCQMHDVATFVNSYPRLDDYALDHLPPPRTTTPMPRPSSTYSSAQLVNIHFHLRCCCCILLFQPTIYTSSSCKVGLVLAVHFPLRHIYSSNVCWNGPKLRPKPWKVLLFPLPTLRDWHLHRYSTIPTWPLFRG
ncbi:hypothetical protein EDD22DRAFT_993904 [Suillus occidentalis]|nr:hypothetical protein EDD22DRAFT_993904 [Suillus occidentalis]